jgi:asparagine synthase (glutamine-hydrolysing)
MPVCGICGVVTPARESVDPGLVRAMSDVLEHRGPDGSGQLELQGGGPGGEARAWLGHRRLKVIDLSERADQPMSVDDGTGTVALTYNGEVYNFRELRTELEVAGHRFGSTGDTEVVLRAYLEWGVDFVKRLDGMFAIALWDGRRGTLVLARDRAGKKPLFYSVRDDRLAFASEIKSLLRVPWLDTRLRAESVGEYLTFGYVPHPGTMYEEVVQVPPAGVVTFAVGQGARTTEYWDPLPPAQDLQPGPDYVETVRELVRQAVRRRLVADVPLGAFLSGGVDSSVVVGLMAEATDEPVRTFSIGFADDQSFDERDYARLVARRFGTNHVESVVRADAVSLMDRLLWLHDQPYADASAVPTYIVGELARRHVTVVLTGDGGDEVFGGYERFAAAGIVSRIPGPVAALGSRVARRLPSGSGYFDLPRRLVRLFQDHRLPVERRYLGWVSVMSEDLLAEMWSPTNGSGPAAVARSYEEPYARAAPLDPLDRLMYVNFKTYLPDDLAVKMDRMSMAHSLEARSPFLDTALVEYLSRLPARHKVRLRRTKPLLRQAFRPLLPDAIWNRRKHGFGAPLDAWFRGELGTMFKDEVLSGDSRLSGMLDATVVRRLWAEHRGGDAHHGLRLWALLTLEHWLRAAGSATPVGSDAGLDLS